MGRVSSPGYGYGYGPRAAPRAEPPTAVFRPVEEPPRRPHRPLRWHIGADLGLMVVRLVLGAVFLAHGAQKMFGSLGGPGLDGFAFFLGENGFPASPLLAGLIAVVELGGGVLLPLGLGTQPAAAGLLGLMINAVWLKAGEGLLGTPVGRPGYEVEVLLAAMTAAVALAGAGRIAVDRALPRLRRPLATGLTCVVVGVGSAVAVRVLLHR